MNRTEQLKAIADLINDGVTREELLNMFDKLGSHILRTESKLVKKIDDKTEVVETELNQLLVELRQVLQDAKEESDSTFGGIKRRMLNVIDTFFAKSEVNKKLNEELQKAKYIILAVETKLANIENGKDGQDGHTPTKGVDYFDGQPGQDGRDADEGKIVKEVLSKIEIKDYQEEIDRLKKELEEVKKLKRGGGTSAIGVAQTFKYIAHTEQPVGAINGVNVTYTVSNSIWWVAGFTLNGENIAELPNFTYAGNTITFSSALPSDYSGRDFEIKYIGV